MSIGRPPSSAFHYVHMSLAEPAIVMPGEERSDLLNFTLLAPNRTESVRLPQTFSFDGRYVLTTNLSNPIDAHVSLPAKGTLVRGDVLLKPRTIHGSTGDIKAKRSGESSGGEATRPSSIGLMKSTIFSFPVSAQI